MKHVVTVVLAIAFTSPADAGKLRWLTDAADSIKVGGVSRALPDEPWLRQPDGSYLDLAIVPDGDGTKLMGKAENGDLIEFTAEQVEEVMGLVADGALSLPTDEEVAATTADKESDLPDWAFALIALAVVGFILWQVWDFLKGLARAGKRVRGWFRRG